jgi:methionine aminopeptidase
MYEAIDIVKPGVNISEIGRVIERIANQGRIMRWISC